MDMLRRLTIQNYQSLSRARIDLGKFTVIIGQSDVGKSAIVRAIRAAVSNQVGQAFIKTGARSAGIGLIFDDLKVGWRKAGASAEYVLEIAGRSDTFTKIGRDIPSKIASAIRMGELTIAGERIWPTIHSQFNLPFLMGATPLERARIIGQITGINTIHSATREVQARDRKAKTELSVYTKQLEETDDRIRAIGDLAAQFGRIQTAESAYQSAATSEASIAAATDLMDAIEAAHRQLASTSKAAGNLEALLSKIQLESAQEVHTNVLSAETMIDTANMLNGDIIGLDRVMDSTETELQDARRELADISVCPLCSQPLGDGHDDSTN
jgi:DNA repair protein SbcC/Rad50